MENNHLQVSKLYILTRQDFNCGYQIAQSVHASMEWTHNNGLWKENIVCLAAKDEVDLWSYYHLFEHLNPVPFFEPDIGNELSAFAVLLNQQQAKPLNKLPLSGFHAITSKGGDRHG